MTNRSPSGAKTSEHFFGLRHVGVAHSQGRESQPAQLATDGEDDPEGETFWKIKHGIRWTGMPAWKDELSDQQIWTLALFLKHMDKLPPAPETAWRSRRAKSVQDVHSMSQLAHQYNQILKRIIFHVIPVLSECRGSNTGNSREWPFHSPS
jgi:cbb3-type cytochrome c oxidase subunit III